jgi:hypothetical protein
VPAGVTAVTVVGLTTVTPVAATPPTVTDVVPLRFVPVSVIAVPPDVGPEPGDTDASVGAATYVKPFARVALPLGVLTATSFAPAVPAGVTAVTVVGLTTVTPVAATPPTVTDVAALRFVPVSVIAVPPDVGPEPGDTDASVGVPMGARATRKPTSKVEPLGENEVRTEERTAKGALVHEPPRGTRAEPVTGPGGSVAGLDA